MDLFRRNWMRIVAAAVLIGGVGVGIWAYGPTEKCGGPEPGVCTVESAFYARLWTIVVAALVALCLLTVDTLRRVGDESEN
jgi:hypothetical protein